MDFKTKFRYCRKSLCFTQQQLADILHVSKRSIAYYESGDREPSAAVLGECAKVFHVPLSYLLLDDVTDPGEAFIEESYYVELNRYKNSELVRHTLKHIIAAGGDSFSEDNEEYDLLLESIANIFITLKNEVANDKTINC